ncbi:MAG: HPP family protein [Beijerinckiaceae bacterium]|nr:HPP family protein [Beijerinckiaceae bacterium]
MNTPSSIARIVTPAIGGTLGIAAMIALAGVANLPLMLAPFTTSIVLVMSSPDSAYARPRNVVGGHVLSALAGFAVLYTLGDTPWFAALAVGLAIAAMQATDTMHPPAGINALIMVVAHPAWTFLFVPVLAGALCLVAFAASYHRLANALARPREVRPIKTADAERPPQTPVS